MLNSANSGRGKQNSSDASNNGYIFVNQFYEVLLRIQAITHARVQCKEKPTDKTGSAHTETIHKLEKHKTKNITINEVFAFLFQFYCLCSKFRFKNSYLVEFIKM